MRLPVRTNRLTSDFPTTAIEQYLRWNEIVFLLVLLGITSSEGSYRILGSCSPICSDFWPFVMIQLPPIPPQISLLSLRSGLHCLGLLASLCLMLPGVIAALWSPKIMEGTAQTGHSFLYTFSTTSLPWQVNGREIRLCTHGAASTASLSCFFVPSSTSRLFRFKTAATSGYELPCATTNSRVCEDGDSTSSVKC